MVFGTSFDFMRKWEDEKGVHSTISHINHVDSQKGHVSYTHKEEYFSE